MTTSGNEQLQQRAQDYVRGRLGEREREAFEFDMVDDPKLMDALEVEIALQQGLRYLPARRVSRPSRFVERFSLPLALAASLVLGIGLGAVISRGAFSESAPSTLSGLYVDQLRGEPQIPGADSSTQSLVLEIPIPHEDPVRVRLLAPDGRALPEQNAKPDPQGLVRILLPATQQAPGTWQVEITAAGRPTDRRQFDIRPISQ